MNFTADQIVAIREEAEKAAHEAAKEYFNNVLGGVDRYPCGFAWVEILDENGKKIKGNTKLGKAMIQGGIRQNWDRIYEIWNPSKFPCQNVDTLEAGARAAALVFKKYGFVAYGCSRLD